MLIATTLHATLYAMLITTTLHATLYAMLIATLKAAFIAVLSTSVAACISMSRSDARIVASAATGFSTSVT